MVQHRLHHYRGYGLHFESEFEMSWPETMPGGKPDILIRSGEVPDALEHPTEVRGYFQAATDVVLLNAGTFVRCLISASGQQVQVTLERNSKHANICILDSILSICLHFRGIFPLNASAIATTEGAALFVGRVGIGKSTLVAALNDLGYPLVADGIVGVQQTAGSRPQVLCGFPQIRLWNHAINVLGQSWQEDNLSPSRPGIENYPVFIPHFCNRKIPLHTVCFLAPGNNEKISHRLLSPSEAFAFLMDNSCRVHILHDMGLDHVHFRTVTDTARYAIAEKLSFPRHDCPTAALTSWISDRLLPPPPFHNR